MDDVNLTFSQEWCGQLRFMSRRDRLAWSVSERGV